MVWDVEAALRTLLLSDFGVGVLGLRVYYGLLVIACHFYIGCDVNPAEVLCICFFHSRMFCTDFILYHARACHCGVLQQLPRFHVPKSGAKIIG